MFDTDCEYFLLKPVVQPSFFGSSFDAGYADGVQDGRTQIQTDAFEMGLLKLLRVGEILGSIDHRLKFAHPTSHIHQRYFCSSDLLML
jgi:hypothetical protein